MMLPEAGFMLSGGAGDGDSGGTVSMHAIPGVAPTCTNPLASGPEKPTFFHPEVFLEVTAFLSFLESFLGNLASISAYSSACRSLLVRPIQNGHS